MSLRRSSDVNMFRILHSGGATRRNILGPNLGLDTGFPHWGLLRPSWAVQTNAGTVS